MHRILAAIALISQLMAPVRPAGPPSIAAVDLRLRDLPSGFTLVSDLDETSERWGPWVRWHGMTAAELARAGRLSGRARFFSRWAYVGLARVETDIEVYASEARLRAAFAADLAAGDEGYHGAHIAGLGTEAVMSSDTTTELSPPVVLIQYRFMFRRGTYWATIAVGFAGGVEVPTEDLPTLAQALAYAKIVDARIAAASR